MSQLMRLWYLSHRRPSKAGEPAHSRCLARAFAVCTHEEWKQTKGPTKIQTSSANGWLRMRVWRMSLQRTKSAIISWHGSFAPLSHPSRFFFQPCKAEKFISAMSCDYGTFRPPSIILETRMRNHPVGLDVWLFGRLNLRWSPNMWYVPWSHGLAHIWKPAFSVARPGKTQTGLLNRR